MRNCSKYEFKAADKEVVPCCASYVGLVQYTAPSCPPATDYQVGMTASVSSYAVRTGQQPPLPGEKSLAQPDHTVLLLADFEEVASDVGLHLREDWA